MRTALSIAGSDSSGGAGIQADIKTMTMNGVYAMSVITALTAQNTTGVISISNSDEKFLTEQIDAVFTDIYPDAVKLGMIPTPDMMKVIGERLTFYKARNIVLDPVMVATSGSKLMEESGPEVMKRVLFPLACVVTPNIPEAETLTGMSITDEAGMEAAAKQLSESCGCGVLIKGGHSINDANDYLYADGSGRWFPGRRVNNPNTHGTGCTLSSAIAANLAKGFSLADSVARAKAYITDALSAMLDLGKGSGPMNHAFALNGVYAEEAE